MFRSFVNLTCSINPISSQTDGIQIIICDVRVHIKRMRCHWSNIRSKALNLQIFGDFEPNHSSIRYMYILQILTCQLRKWFQSLIRFLNDDSLQIYTISPI